MGRPIWQEFCRMGRPPSMNGMERITAQEIIAHQTLYSVRFTRWELDTIAMFDSIAVEISNKK